MSIFTCCICDNYNDADDGCEVHPEKNELICQSCVEEDRADEIFHKAGKCLDDCQVCFGKR